MWLDVQAALAEIEGDETPLCNSTPRATTATTATLSLVIPLVSHMSHVLQDLETVTTAPWDSTAWQVYFDERAGVAEFDGGLSRDEADSMAYNCCVAEWLCQNFQTSEPGHCSVCGACESDSDPVLPYGDENNGHIWLHGHCWPDWYRRRQGAAIVALAGLGIVRRLLPRDR